MKKIIGAAIGIFLTTLATAQSLEEVKQHLYYGREKSASEVVGTIVQNDPFNAQAWYWLSRTAIERDHTKGLTTQLQAAPAAITADPWYAVAYGAALLQEKRSDSARIHFEQALNRTKEKDADILLAIARAHIDAPEADVAYAMELLNKGVKRDKHNPELYMALGDAYRRLNKGTEAYRAYQDALDKDNRYAPALFALGKIFTTQKNTEMYLEYFNKALAADSKYAPALYELYRHYYYTDPVKAMEYFNQYAALADKDPLIDYLRTDLLYLARQYNEAIIKAQQLLQSNSNPEPRLYKLIAYSYQGLKDSAAALKYMQAYFAKAPDSVHVVMDYLSMGEMLARSAGKEDSAALYLEKAVVLQTDTIARYELYKKLTELYGVIKDYSAQASWLAKYYTNNAKATNLDLFNWGLAHFRAQEYTASDSVFALYAQKYPEQAFGYYWRARSNAVIDKGMEAGLAVPHYEKVIEIASQDTTNETNRKWLVEAYAYLAAYATNTKKDYATAVAYFEKLLQIDPENADAKKYIGVLQKNLDKKSATEG